MFCSSHAYINQSFYLISFYYIIKITIPMFVWIKTDNHIIKFSSFCFVKSGYNDFVLLWLIFQISFFQSKYKIFNYVEIDIFICNFYFFYYFFYKCCVFVFSVFICYLPIFVSNIFFVDQIVFISTKIKKILHFQCRRNIVS